MHDIDRTMTEFEADEFESSDEFEFEQGDGELDEFEAAVFDETEEMELAAELLSVSDEAELDQFLGKLFKRAGRTLGRFVKSPVGRRLGGFLKGAIRKALPVVGGAAGTLFGGPAGAAIGSRLASAGGQMFGLELEGMSPEDQEFEVARRLVRLSGEAAKQAAGVSSAVDPAAAAKSAAVAAAQRYAPGLLRPVVPGSASGGRRTGRWVRHGRRIVLMGV
jgi:hypothetical protein